MAVYVFQSRDAAGEEVVLKVETVSLADLLRAMARFLRGAGFVFDGELDVVPDPDPEAGRFTDA